MNYHHMTAPCGLDCFNCTFYLAHEDAQAMEQLQKWSEHYNIPTDVMLCKGCREHNGRIPLQSHLFGDEHRCGAYECSSSKKVAFCGECEDFPCDYLHPYADKAETLPHNTKVFNLCLINKMGVEQWAATRAAEVRNTYFNTPWSLAE